MADKTKPFVGYMYLEIAGAGSPSQYTRICEATGISGIGKTNALVESTTFCSNGTREYIPGLADGAEITIDANYIVSSAMRRLLMEAVDDRSNVQMRLVVDQDADDTIDEEYRFEAAALSYTLNPSLDEKNAVSFTFKISGVINYIDHYSAGGP